MYRISLLEGNRLSDVCFYYPAKPTSEAELWKPLGKFLADCDYENETITAQGEDGSKAVISIDDHVFHLVEDGFDLKKTLYPKKMLRRVDLEHNRKSFYDLVPNNMGSFLTVDVGARYGVLGTDVEESRVLPRPFPSQLFWARYYAKLRAGYSDETDLLGEGEDILKALFGNGAHPESDEDETAVELYRLLVHTAKEYLDSQFNIDWLSEKSPYTARQVESCWKILGGLISTLDIEETEKMVQEANRQITKLLKIASPTMKKGKSISSFAVAQHKSQQQTIKDIRKKADEWENRIMAMDAVVGQSSSKKNDEELVSPFGNISVRKADADEFTHYQKLIEEKTPDMVGMLKDVYILDPIARRQRYEEALEKAEDKSEEELFHGSRTENMVSLIKSGGPTIHVTASNGRMFGNGSYWANNFDKSLGYTSFSNSRWAHGDAMEAYMLVGQVHTGKKYFTSFTGNDEQETKDGGYDCCYALADNTSLYRDEIITYDEEHSYVKAILRIAEDNTNDTE